jgi:hypothetical protein
MLIFRDFREAKISRKPVGSICGNPEATVLVATGPGVCVFVCWTEQDWSYIVFYWLILVLISFFVTLTVVYFTCYLYVVLRRITNVNLTV